MLIRRMKEREKEREADARDRQREKEELEEIRRKLMDEGHPDPEAELAKVGLTNIHSRDAGLTCTGHF